MVACLKKIRACPFSKAAGRVLVHEKCFHGALQGSEYLYVWRYRIPYFSSSYICVWNYYL